MQTVCPKCGSKFNYDVQFCDKCGANLEKVKSLNEQKNTLNNSSVTPNNKYQGYVQIIAVIEITFGLVGLVAGLLVVMISPFIKDIILSSPNAEQTVTYSNGMYQLFTGLLIFIAIIILLVSVSCIYFGYKLYNLESKGRFGSMIIASLSLLAIPFGTVFGIIALVILNRSEAIQLLSHK